MGVRWADAHARAAEHARIAAAGGGRRPGCDARGDRRSAPGAAHWRRRAGISPKSRPAAAATCTRHAGVRVAELAGDRQHVRARVQPDPRISARRRADRPGADLVAHGRPQPRHALDGPRRPGVRAAAGRARAGLARGAATRSACSRWLLAFILYQARQRGGGAGNVRAAHRGRDGRRHHGPRARDDPRGAQPARRPGAVLPALPLAVVRGGRPGAPLPRRRARAARGRGDRRRTAGAAGRGRARGGPAGADRRGSAGRIAAAQRGSRASGGDGRGRRRRACCRAS